jgi:hypothetical protein
MPGEMPIFFYSVESGVASLLGGRVPRPFQRQHVTKRPFPLPICACQLQWMAGEKSALRFVHLDFR